MSGKKPDSGAKSFQESPSPRRAKREPNPWGDGTDDVALRPWDMSVLQLLPPIEDITRFWNQMVEFVARDIRQTGRSKSVVDHAKVSASVEKFCGSYFPEPIPEAACSRLAELVKEHLDKRINEREIRRLSALIKELKLPYVVTAADVAQYKEFVAAYDIAHSENSPDWLSGPDLLQKWEVTPAQFAARWNGLLPSYLWNRQSGRFECVTGHVRAFRSFLETHGSDSSDLHTTRRPPLWFSVPQWRHFRREEVEFFEKTHPGFTKKYGPIYSLLWLDFSELMQRWLCKPIIIETAVRKAGLPAYLLNPIKGISRATDDDLTRHLEIGPPLKLLCLFNLNDVRQFEADHVRSRPRDSLIGLSPVGHRRIRARDLATKLHLEKGWNKSQIIGHFEAEYVFCNREGEPYSENQVKRWLQGLQFAKRGAPRKRFLPKK